MALLQLLLVLLLSAVALGWVARHFKFPYPIALVAGGALLGLVPNLPSTTFDPQLILVAVLPPILYQAALLTSWTDFKAHLRPISLLAIGLVTIFLYYHNGASPSRPTFPLANYPSGDLTATSTRPPDDVYLTALSSRFAATCSSRTRSAETTTSSAAVI